MKLMKKQQTNYFLTLGFCLCLAVAPIKNAQACESSGGIWSGQALLQVVTDAVIAAAQSALSSFIGMDITVAEDEQNQRMQEFQDNVNNWWNDWWRAEMRPSMQDMTRQLNVAKIDQIRQFGSFIDGQLQSRVLLKKQEIETKAQEKFTPAESVCVGGTAAAGLTRVETIRKQMVNALDKKNLDRVVNSLGTPGENGAESDIRDRISKFAGNFCDPAGNNGANALLPGCIAGLAENADVLVGHTLFDNFTLDLSNDRTNLAVNALVKNLVTPVAEPPVPQLETDTQHDRVKRQLNRRAKAAKRSVAHAVVADVVAKRTPGSNLGPATLQSMGTAANIDTTKMSDNPSVNEIETAMAKLRYMDPNYFSTRVNNNPIQESTMSKATNLSLIRNEYETLEKTATLLATSVTSQIDSSGDF